MEAAFKITFQTNHKGIVSSASAPLAPAINDIILKGEIREMEIPVLIHLPHSSTFIPDAVRNEILLNVDELQSELLRLTDRYTDELFMYDDVVIHKNQYSRLVFDPERFRSDSNETMARFGMGAIYTHTADYKVLRKLTDKKREEMMQKYYDPYHASLTEKAQQLLDCYENCLIIDGHSFPEKPLPFEEDKSSGRPDICIGTCDFHTPEALVEGMEKFIGNNKMTVRRNFPFAGTMVPLKFYMKDKRVSSVMIEVNRRLYMNEDNGEKLACFDAVKNFIQDLIKVAIQQNQQTDGAGF